MVGGNHARKLDHIPYFPTELLGRFGPDDAAATIAQEGPLLFGGQDVLGVHSEEVLPLDREVGKELLGVRRQTHEPAEPIVAGHTLHAGNTRDPVLVSPREIKGKAHRVPRDQPGGACALEIPTDGGDQGLERAKEKDAHRHGQDCASGANPVVLQVLGDIAKEPHGLWLQLSRNS